MAEARFIHKQFGFKSCALNIWVGQAAAKVTVAWELRVWRASFTPTVVGPMLQQALVELWLPWGRDQYRPIISWTSSRNKNIHFKRGNSNPTLWKSWNTSSILGFQEPFEVLYYSMLNSFLLSPFLSNTQWLKHECCKMFESYFLG